MGWFKSSLGRVVCSCEPLDGSLDLLSPCSLFGRAVLFPSYRFGTLPVSVALPVALPLVDSDGAAGRFITDSAPGGAAGMVGFCELPAAVPGANVLVGAPLEGEGSVELELAEGAGGMGVDVCTVGIIVVGAIIVVTAGATASVAPVQGSIGTFITMVRGVR
jgi:hypothetical protein